MDEIETAFHAWYGEHLHTEGLYDYFRSGWLDAVMRKSDFNRRRYLGDRREAYMAGRSAYNAKKRKENER